MPADNPYQAPGDVDERHSQQTSIIYVVACLMWAALAITLAVLRPIAGWFFQDFDAELPAATIYLLHPMSTVLLFAIAGAVISAGLIAKSEEDRNRVGRIGAVFGLLAFTTIALGFGLPVWSLLRAIQ